MDFLRGAAMSRAKRTDGAPITDHGAGPEKGSGWGSASGSDRGPNGDREVALPADPDADRLAVALAAGEADALGEILRRNWPNMVRFATRIQGARDVAEDIAQDAFVQLWLNRATFARGGSITAFLYRVARNLALNEVRHREVRDRLGSGDRDVETPVALAPDEALDVQGLEETVARALAELPKRQRTVFVLARYEGLTHVEISKILGTSPQTVANQMTAALTHLRNALSFRRDAAPIAARTRAERRSAGAAQ
jgi:RNA polymerase sigma-70 factor (family 1)